MRTIRFIFARTVRFYFGLDFAGLAAIIDVDEDKETISGNELTVDDIVWMGTQPTLKEKSQSVGVSHTAPARHERSGNGR